MSGKEYKSRSAQADALLVLQDGTVFNGKAIGKIGTTTGELAFNTGMTGYQEVFTDPSYYGQILIETNVHIGNYGVNKEEVESKSVKISGLVCKSFNEVFSRKDATSIREYLSEVVGISDIDTRALVRHVRNAGAMNAIISSENTDVEALKKQLAQVPSMEGLELSSKVSTKEPYFLGSENAKYKVAVLDLGVKQNILRCLAERDCYLKVFPMHSSIDDMLAFKPDGFMITNGPGDPGAMREVVATVKEIINREQKVFGICLGHQIIAETQGIRTYKMHNGHRGLNHPVKNLITGKSEITSQNHGFAIKADDIKEGSNIEITHINLNDNTVEGIRLKDKPVFCVQYHPEAAAGPHDSRYLFDDFIKLMAK